LLRDDFQSRAMTLHRSSMSALEAAQSAAQLSGPDRHARVAQLNAEASRLNQVGAQVAQLAEQAPAAAGAGRG
jgi:hypothetical protein